MSENPYAPSTSTGSGFRLVQCLTRLSLLATYPFLVLSLLLPAGLVFGSAFIAGFVIQNDTDQPLDVTPVGTVGPQGRRSPLPVQCCRFPTFPAWQRGGFRLAPGESISILYDMDDINFSEIVVREADGISRQLVVNPNPTTNQYHAPSQRRFVIRDLTSLGPVPGPVLAASNVARLPTNGPWIMLGLILLPWPAYIGLWYLNRRISQAGSRCKELSPSDANAA